jgi:hypothetical protein
MDLDLGNYKENKHISIINISDNHEIVINSPEVHFGIKREHAEVGHKNLTIFSYKNDLDRFSLNRNNSYRKIYNITLCNFRYKI